MFPSLPLPLPSLVSKMHPFLNVSNIMVIREGIGEAEGQRGDGKKDQKRENKKRRKKEHLIVQMQVQRESNYYKMQPSFINKFET